MKNTHLLARLSLGVSLILLAACGNQQQEYSEEQDGREETRTIRNTEAIGYSGDAIADKLDAALDANDQRIEEMDEAADEY